jgi:dihydrofolate synthase/folylpolyglutamate synthase
MYQRVGASAFKKGLDNIQALCQALGAPETRFKSVHVAGTNGKGSTSHLLASMLQAAGYRVGLYTSPHLKSFTERIRINGREIAPEEVVAFVGQIQPLIERIKPSFFELTVIMAFHYFAKMSVDYAVIEVGLGGRLDSTNVITPQLSVITNIGYDHQDMLGETLPEIASEKAGIIKHRVPVVVSEEQPEVAQVFKDKASAMQAPLTFASRKWEVKPSGQVLRNGEPYIPQLRVPLHGSHQLRNLAGVLEAAEQLRIPLNAVWDGIEQVLPNTGLKGRWQRLADSPLTYCDVGHNEDGVRVVLDLIAQTPHQALHIVWGMVSDKKREKILRMLPAQARYYFCRPDVPRGCDAALLRAEAADAGLSGQDYPSVAAAMAAARAAAGPEDLIFAGGSTFVVAELEV